MKIVFITTKLNLVNGGGSNINIDFKARLMQQRGHDVKMITTSRPVAGIENCKYKVIQEDIGSSNYFNVRKQTAKLLWKYEKDANVFHLDGHYFLFGGGLYKKQGGKTPITAHFDNYLLSMGMTRAGQDTLRGQTMLFLIKQWERLIGLKQANKIEQFTCASDTLKRIYTKHGVNMENAKFMPAFVDVSRYLDLSEDRGRKPTNILYVGRLTKDKGVDLLVKAAQGLKELKFNIVGQGEDEDEIKKMDKSGVVKFYPWQKQNDLREFYKKADIFVHPARWPEPFGMTVVEAMASGVPVITTEGTGSSEIASEGGIIVKKDSVEDIKEAISKLTTNIEYYKKLQIQAVAKAKEFHYKNWEDFFEKLITNQIQK